MGQTPNGRFLHSSFQNRTIGFRPQGWSSPRKNGRDGLGHLSPRLPLAQSGGRPLARRHMIPTRRPDPVRRARCAAQLRSPAFAPSLSRAHAPGRGRLECFSLVAMPRKKFTGLNTWTGVDGFTPGYKGIYGEHHECQRLFVIAGANEKGFKVSPAIGMGTAELIAAGHSSDIVKPEFSSARFTKSRVTGQSRYIGVGGLI